jgi:hypothetical protein
MGNDYRVYRGIKFSFLSNRRDLDVIIGQETIHEEKFFSATQPNLFAHLTLYKGFDAGMYNTLFTVPKSLN